MAGIHLSIDSSGLRQIQERVQVMANLDTTSLMPRLGEYLLASTEDRFKTQTDPEGDKWQALKHPARKFQSTPAIADGRIVHPALAATARARTTITATATD